jgi:endonuclease YncB( thermonuclease family)
MIVTAYLCAAVSVCDTTPTRVFVLDGDTVVINHERIRIAGIDAPEVKGKCAEEKRLAAMATHLLARIVNGSQILIDRQPKPDRYGRTLAAVSADGRDVGEVILREGLARKWTKKFDYREEPWCLGGRQKVTGQIDGGKVIGLLLELAN